MDGKNVEQLTERLVELGFSSSVDMALQCSMCFEPGKIQLTHTEVSGKDLTRYVVCAEHVGDGVYSLLYYLATLRREVVVPSELLQLDREMPLVNWKAIASNDVALVDKASVEAAFVLVKQIKGPEYDVLKFKHWVDTALELIMPNILQLKSRYEITEKFYLHDHAHTIKFAEANRFLHNKWREKQVAVSKKLLMKKTELPAGAGVGKGKLIAKNTRRDGRQGLKKKT